MNLVGKTKNKNTVYCVYCVVENDCSFFLFNKTKRFEADSDPTF